MNTFQCSTFTSNFLDWHLLFRDKSNSVFRHPFSCHIFVRPCFDHKALPIFCVILFVEVFLAKWISGIKCGITSSQSIIGLLWYDVRNQVPTPIKLTPRYLLPSLNPQLHIRRTWQSLWEHKFSEPLSRLQAGIIPLSISFFIGSITILNPRCTGLER